MGQHSGLCPLSALTLRSALLSHGSFGRCLIPYCSVIKLYQHSTLYLVCLF